jgi:hypothetical protein
MKRAAMNRSSFLVPLRAGGAIALTVLLAGCGMLMPQQAGTPSGGQPGGGGQTASTYSVPKESQDAVRKQEQQAYSQADDSADQELDRLEKDALKAVKLALGKDASSPGMPPPESSSTALRGIQAAKMKVRLEPVVDGDGKAVNEDFFQLKDSYTERVQQLQRKIVEHKASKKEMREIQEGSKQIMKINDLRQQVMAVSMQVMMSNNHVLNSSLQQMLRVSQLVRSRKMMSMDINADDYALVRRGLERQKRAEAIAATTLAMLGTYQAVINDNGDPKALDIIAEATLKAFPVKAQVTDDDAKKYVSALGENVSKVKGRYEAMLRKVHGDARYEKQYKAGIDAMFKQAEDAQNQKSVGQMVNDTNAKYKADIEKCKRGEDPGPASMAGGPTCKKVFQAAQTGDTSELPPGARKAFDETGGAPSGARGAPMGAKLGDREQNVVKGVTSAVNGDLDGALDAAGKMFPADGTIGASLKGINALRKGDAKGAIEAALSFVPVPGLKDAFGLASKLLFK